MDGTSQHTGPQVDVEAVVREIKAHMPDTYRAIRAKADEIGTLAYAYVRRSIAGQPNLFYAMERGHVVGTPFNQADITAAVAQAMVAYGCKSLLIWALAPQEGGADGAH